MPFELSEHKPPKTTRMVIEKPEIESEEFKFDPIKDVSENSRQTATRELVNLLTRQRYEDFARHAAAAKLSGIIDIHALIAANSWREPALKRALDNEVSKMQKRKSWHGFLNIAEEFKILYPKEFKKEIIVSPEEWEEIRLFIGYQSDSPDFRLSLIRDMKIIAPADMALNFSFDVMEGLIKSDENGKITTSSVAGTAWSKVIFPGRQVQPDIKEWQALKADVKNETNLYQLTGNTASLRLAAAEAVKVTDEGVEIIDRKPVVGSAKRQPLPLRRKFTTK